MANRPQHFLVAVLDWGLGHATRSIPVINQLMSLGHKVSVAGNGPSEQLLKAEFPTLEFFELEPYDISYPTSGSFKLHLLKQVPKLMQVIQREHQQLENLIQKHGVDVVISDQRFGCYSSRIPSVIITHQLTIQAGWASAVVNFFNQRMIRKFDQRWVPDTPDFNLSGKLAQDYPSARCIGLLSRFKKLGLPADQDLIVGLVSGPESQRTVFEELLAREFETWPGRAVILRGMKEGPPRIHSKVRFMDHLKAAELNVLLEEAGIVVARSGYSTLLDLAQVEKKNIILIPTPGQTEQEYLAQRMENRTIAHMVRQHAFNLTAAVATVRRYHGFDRMETHSNLLQNAIQELTHFKL